MQLLGRAELERRVRDAQEALQDEIRHVTARTAQSVKAAAVVAAPQSSGALRQGITVTTSPRGSVATVRARARHAAAVSSGRRSGAKMPPRKALVEWAKSRGIDPKLAFVLARAIAQKGIRARPFLDEAWARHRAAFASSLERIVDRFIQRTGSR